MASSAAGLQNFPCCRPGFFFPPDNRPVMIRNLRTLLTRAQISQRKVTSAGFEASRVQDLINAVRNPVRVQNMCVAEAWVILIVQCDPEAVQ